MKRSFALILAITMFLSLAACSKTEPEISTPVPDFSAQSSEEENSTPMPACYVVSNGEMIEAYENFVWSNDYDEKGWLCADGEYYEDLFPLGKDEIPEVTYSEDFQVIYGESVTSKTVNVYDENFGQISENGTLEDLSALPGGTYYLVLQVRTQGKYIEEEKKSESSCSEYIYKLTIE